MTHDNLAREETEPLLGALLRMPYQAMMLDGVEPALLAAGFTDIRSAHLPVLQALTRRPEGLRATDLAAETRMTKQSMGYLVDALEANGYVERVPDAVDGRAKVVRLTAHGTAAIRAIRAAVREVEAKWAAQVGAERLEQLRATLQELATSLAREERPHSAW